STGRVLTKLLTFAYKSTCWKAMSSPGTDSDDASIPFFKANTFHMGAGCTESILLSPSWSPPPPQLVIKRQTVSDKRSGLRMGWLLLLVIFMLIQRGNIVFTFF